MVQAAGGPAEKGEANTAAPGAEQARLEEVRTQQIPWRRWGPYLSERQWGTVREDYSADGDAWDYFPHDQARSRAYRWGEDGLLGFCDDRALLCFAPALWNEADPILKERLFGLSGNQGNHGEDVKEYYYYLDGTPTHSYMKGLYKYPQRAFPYEQLVTGNQRSRFEPELELIDTGIFAENRYFDIQIEYAKAAAEDMVIRVTASNRGPETAPLHVLPTLWFRNTWSWGRDDRQPQLDSVPSPEDSGNGSQVIHAQHESLGEYWLYCDADSRLLFTENVSNRQLLYKVPNATPYVKDGFHNAVVHGLDSAVNAAGTGTKAAAHYRFMIEPGGAATITLRLANRRHDRPFADADKILKARQTEADHFYHAYGAPAMTEDERRVQRQAFAGLMWSKQFYHFEVQEWLDGDPAGPPPPPERQNGRNSTWRHLHNADVISMPDTWEYPWYAAWDLAFHCVPLAMVDAEFAKNQLVLLQREWYMHPNGQLPAYEWAFSDVNPPVQAWAALRVYKIERRLTGREDRAFLERVFLKLLLNFTWWVNRKDADGRNVFQGGFLGLDNIGVFDRSAPLPTGGRLEQADGTAWMGMFCLNMLAIAIELASDNPVYEDLAVKFFEHFLYIAKALNNIGGEGVPLWNDDDEFFYDVLHLPDGAVQPLKVRSLVGLMPLLAVQVIEPETMEKLPWFSQHMQWFLDNRPELAGLTSRWYEPGVGERRLVALVRGHRMKRLLARMLDSQEFLGDHGIRSLSKYHEQNPFVLHVNGMEYAVRYEPAESHSGLFGGNSNWRGPIWFPLNHLLIEALQRFHHYYGDDFLVEYPTGSGTQLTLWQVADALSRRLIAIFLRDEQGNRPVFGNSELFNTDPYWRDLVPFYEYFNGDNGAGVGASHQTGWTALVAKLLDQTARI